MTSDIRPSKVHQETNDKVFLNAESELKNPTLVFIGTIFSKTEKKHFSLSMVFLIHPVELKENFIPNLNSIK